LKRGVGPEEGGATAVWLDLVVVAVGGNKEILVLPGKVAA
jgi:hypothetical protein